MPKKPDFTIPDISLRPLRLVAEHEGGFGRVLIVEAVEGARYALKTIKDTATDAKREFAAEAAKLARIQGHLHVLPIRGIVWFEDQPYMLLPAMAGNLRDLFLSRRGLGERVLPITKQILSGLAYLHDQEDLLHLDLKPENILVANDHRVLISDFGLSEFLPSMDDPDRQAGIKKSKLVGTVSYMSPEHFVSGDLSHKSDMFSVGVILFEMLVGRHPFMASDLERTASKILTHDPSSTASERKRVSPSLYPLCLACLEKNPRNRPAAKEALDSVSGSGEPLAPVAPRQDLTEAVGRANALSQLGRASEAEELLQRCISQNPSLLPAHIARAELAFRRGDVRGAGTIAEKAIKSASWQPQPKREVVTLLVNLANYYLSMDPKTAIRFARMAMRLDPEDWQACGNLAEACRVLGEARGDRQLLQEGLNAVESALDKAPRDLKLLVTYGGLLLANGDLEALGPQVIGWINEFGGDDVHLRFLLIRALIADGKVGVAEQWLDPMRPYPPLAPLVEIADREIAEAKKRHRTQ